MAVRVKGLLVQDPRNYVRKSRGRRVRSLAVTAPLKSCGPLRPNFGSAIGFAGGTLRTIAR